MSRRVARTILIAAGVATGGTLVVPVRPETLSAEDRDFATTHHDLKIP